MRLPGTLYRYVAREVCLYAGIGFLAFSSILIAQNLLRRLEDLVAVGFVARDAVSVVASLLPMLAAYALPVAFLFGVLVALGRLAADAEVTAMRACGRGLQTLLAPVLVLAAATCALTAVLIVRVEPEARQRLRGVLVEVASRGAILEPGRFRILAGRIVYVQDRDRENRLKRVLLADRTDPQRPFIILAERGSFRFDPERVTIVLELEDGELHLDPRGPDDPDHRHISFERFRFAIDADPLLAEARRQRPNEMSLPELREALGQAEAGTLAPEARSHNPDVYRTQIQRRLALPAAPLVFALVGVPLALRRTRGARSRGTLLCVALVLGYYALLTAGQYLAQEGRLPAPLALWMPNAVFALVALPLLLRARRGGE